MAFYISEQEVEKTYNLHFEKLVIAQNPSFPNQEIAFRDAQIILAAYYDKQARKWKPRRNKDGKPASLELIAPAAKRIVQGKVTKFDAFHRDGKLQVVPIPLTSIQKQGWNDNFQDSLRISVLDSFWSDLAVR